jgi:uncharacterized protein (TIGR02271 family)
MATKNQTTVGVFESRAAAERMVAELRAAGYRDDQIGVVAKDERGNAVRTDGAGDSHAGEGAAIGAAAGAGALALGSLGMSFGVIPVIGPILADGPSAAALISAAGGAAAGGIAGALIGWGIPEEDARYYEGEVNAGRYVVTVTGDRPAEARALFTQHGGYDRATAGTRTATASTVAATGGRTMEVKEERLRADKERVNTGEVEVRKEVHTEHKRLDVPVEREEVVIERRPASGHATGEIRAEEIRIPVKEEQVRVTKEPVVKEEVTVGKRKVQDTQTVTGEVKKEEVVVDTEGQAKVRQTGKKDKK